MNKRITLIAISILTALLIGCASTPLTRVSGNASASRQTGDITTTTVTAPDGTVTVTEVCTQCARDESVGDKGSDRFYEAIVGVFGVFVGVASIVMQAM